MMRRSLLAPLIVAALAMPVFAGTGKVDKRAEIETVGGFAVKLATALKFESSDPKVAAASLRAAGVSLGPDLKAPLTEEMAAQILSDLGLKVATPKNPRRQITVGLGTQIAGSPGLDALSLAGGPPPQPPPPTECLTEPNRGACQECCKAATRCGPGPNRFDCNVCAKFCKSVLPPGQISPSEPGP